MGGIIAPKHGEGCICLLQQLNKHQYKYTGCNSQMSVKAVGQASMASILDSYINVEVQGMSLLLHA